MIKRIDIQGSTGSPMRVLLIPAGEACSNHLHLGVDPSEADLVEFYDGRYPHTPDGQFISRYYASTLLEDPHTVGLDLMGYEPSWKVDGKTMKLVLNWITYHQSEMEAQS